MRFVRLFWRLLAVTKVSVVGWAMVLLGNALFWRRFAFQRRRAWQRRVYRRWASLVCRILGVHLEIDGRVPDPPCLLITNHVSYIDILVIASVLPARFVAKREIGSWPFIGGMCRAVDTIFIDRSSRRDTIRVGEEMATGLSAGDAIVLFPEGTSHSGYRVEPFRPPLLAPAASSDLPVHYGAITYRTPEGETPAYLAVSWWANMPFGPHAWELLKISRVDARLRFGARPLRDTDRKQLTQRLHAAVNDLFDPVVDFEPPVPPDYPPKRRVPGTGRMR